MKLVRLPLLALAALSFAACSTDLTTPEARTTGHGKTTKPAGPLHDSGTYQGSGGKIASDTLSTSTSGVLTGNTMDLTGTGGN